MNIPAWNFLGHLIISTKHKSYKFMCNLNRFCFWRMCKSIFLECFAYVVRDKRGFNAKNHHLLNRITVPLQFIINLFLHAFWCHCPAVPYSFNSTRKFILNFDGYLFKSGIDLKVPFNCYSILLPGAAIIAATTAYLFTNFLWAVCVFFRCVQYTSF